MQESFVEESLDPQDWDRFAELAHQMVDGMIAEFKALRDLPAWQPVPDRVRHVLLDEPVPWAPQGEARPYREFIENVLPYRNGNIGPRFFGWVQGNGTPLGMMADMLASGLNAHMAGYDQAPALVEDKVVDWFRELLGFPDGASGILLSGGSMANLTGLLVARHAKAGYDIRAEGLRASGAEMVIYGSSEIHSWVFKALEAMGMGRRALRTVPVRDDYTIDVTALEAAIVQDRAQGLHPIAVVGTAGTVNTGATDDLDALADLCAEHDLWLHIDGAFGALAALSPKLRPIVRGLERADSVAFDLHKWMYLPFELACLLVRNGEAHRATFATSASYIADLERGPTAGGFRFAELGLELTRGFKALKAWMNMKAYGVEAFARLIEQNVEQAHYLAGRVGERPELEVLADVPLNIVCFRYRFGSVSAERGNELNQELLLRIQEQGIAVPSSTVLNGRFAIRVCIANHRTRREDLDLLLDAVLRIGAELEESA